MKNDQTKKPENARTENEKDSKVTKQKTDRLDRLENDMQLLKAGTLVAINTLTWIIASISPIGVHDPDTKTELYETLEEAIKDNTDE